MRVRQLTIQQSLLLVGVILLMIGWQWMTYNGRNYRQDEINTIHAAKIMSSSEITFWMATNIHPPAWRLLADSWIDAFGDAEQVVRWVSVLANCLTFAFLFRLGKDLLDWRLGLLAALLLGVYPAAANYMNELRPYPYLIMLVTGLHVFFLRWIQFQRFQYMLGYIIFGILALYTHYYAIYIFPAHLIFMLITVRWNTSFYLRTISMWLLIGLSFSGWLIPFIHSFTVRQRGGIYYALPNQVIGLQLLYERIRFIPEQIGQFLLLTGLATPLFFHFRSSSNLRQRWVKYRPLLYSLVISISILGIAWGANIVIKNVTDRNMTILLPTLVMLMALGWRALPKPTHIILAMILILGATQLSPRETSNAPYREIVAAMSEHYQADSVLITEFDTAFQWLLPAAYTLMDFAPIEMSKQQMLHVIDSDDGAHTPGPPDRLVNVYDSITSDVLNTFAQSHSQLWILQQGGGNSHHEVIFTWLKAYYAEVEQHQWREDYPTTYTLTEYARVPDNDGQMLRAGDDFALYAWSLKDSVDVVPCQTIRIESWWQTQQPSDNPYELMIILADDNRQVAINEQTPANVFTINWQTDTYYRDISPLTIPCDISEGSYNLLLGMKDSITGEVLPLTYPDGNSIGTSTYLTTLNTNGS